MKKFMKGCSIAAICMLGVGMLLSVISGIARGWTAIPIGDLLSSATHGMVQLPNTIWDYHELRILDDDWSDLFDEEDIQEFTDVYENISGERKEQSVGNDIQKLKVEVGECAMEFCKSEDNEFHVETINMENFKCYVKDNTLYLESTHHINHLTGDAWKKRGVRLYVPEGAAFSEVDIEFGAGSLELADFTADKVELDIGAGVVMGQEISAGKMEISLGAGSAELKEMQVGEASMDVGMGMLEFDGSIQNKADIECGMGSVSMKLLGAEEDFNYEIEGAMGSVEIGSHDYSGLAQERKINNGADKKIEVDCAMGSIEISFKD